jgi:hypothetical protein
VYGALSVDAAPSRIRFTVARARGRLLLQCEGEPDRLAAGEDELLDMLDELIAVQLQRRRSDLFFVHSAVLELGGRAVLLVAPSGVGKSTTTWALSHHGFRYVTDELAPIEPASLRVHPFLRAPRLKVAPPDGYPLPAAARRTGRAIHLALEDLPGGLCRDPLPIGAVVFLHRPPAASTPSIRPVSGAEAAARLVANALNPLAHCGDGLDPAVAIARGVPCFSLRVADLPSTCRLLRTTVAGLRGITPSR